MSTIYQYDVKRGQQLGQTDYYGVGGDMGLIQSFHLQWDAALICTEVSVWATDFPENGPFAVPITSVVAGEWVEYQPPSGYTAISPAGAAVAGASSLIISIPGGTAGGWFVDLGNTAAHRLRVKVVCTQAGFLRIHAAGKR